MRYSQGRRLAAAALEAGAQGRPGQGVERATAAPPAAAQGPRLRTLRQHHPVSRYTSICTIQYSHALHILSTPETHAKCSAAAAAIDQGAFED